MSNSRTQEIFLFDIFVAICKIEIVCGEFGDANELLHDFVSWDSVIREFEIIGEATNICIKKELVDSEYRMVVDFRNKITHHYFGIDHDAVWSIVHQNIPGYKAYIVTQIQNIEDKALLRELIKSTKVDNKSYPRVLERLVILEKPPR